MKFTTLQIIIIVQGIYLLFWTTPACNSKHVPSRYFRLCIEVFNI